MLWFCRQDSRAFMFCSHWEQTVKIKSLTYSKQRRTFVKPSVRPQLHAFPCLGMSTPGHILTKSTGTSLALWASNELAVLHAAALSLQLVCRWASRGEVASRLWEPSHAYWEMDFQPFGLCDLADCHASQTPENMKVQIQFISAYISTWAPSQVPIFPVQENWNQQMAT